MLTGPANVVALHRNHQSGTERRTGRKLFVLPTPVNFSSQNTKYTATATVINDNTSTVANLFFTGSVLDSAEAIGVYGYNLFNNIEIGDPGWTISYGARQWYGLCQQGAELQQSEFRWRPIFGKSARMDNARCVWNRRAQSEIRELLLHPKQHGHVAGPGIETWGLLTQTALGCPIRRRSFNLTRLTLCE